MSITAEAAAQSSIVDDFATAPSNGRVKLSALRRLFSFAVVRQLFLSVLV